MIAVALIQFYL